MNDTIKLRTNFHETEKLLDALGIEFEVYTCYDEYNNKIYAIRIDSLNRTIFFHLNHTATVADY